MKKTIKMEKASKIEERNAYYRSFMIDSGAGFIDDDLLFSEWKDEIVKIKKGEKGVGLYLHIPFCQKICHFCDCYSGVGSTSIIKDYLDLIYEELNKFSGHFTGVEFETLYFGGGTPSMLSSEQIRELMSVLFSKFNLSKAHSTFECSPITLNEDKLRVLADFKINRITLGIQSFDGKVLLANNRPHVPFAMIQQLVDSVKKKGMLINLELISGLIGQDANSLLNDLDMIEILKPNQFHVYDLIYNSLTMMKRLGHSEPASLEKNKKVEEKIQKIKEGYQDFPFSFSADRQVATNMQIYNSRVNSSSLLGIGDGALSKIKKDFIYSSLSIGGKIKYGKTKKEFIDYCDLV